MRCIEITNKSEVYFTEHLKVVESDGYVSFLIKSEDGFSFVRTDCKIFDNYESIISNYIMNCDGRIDCSKLKDINTKNKSETKNKNQNEKSGYFTFLLRNAKNFLFFFLLPVIAAEMIILIISELFKIEILHLGLSVNIIITICSCLIYLVLTFMTTLVKCLICEIYN